MKTVSINQLRKHALFSMLSSDELASVLTESVRVSLPAHWSLPLGRKSGGFFYLLVSGNIQIVATSSSGRSIDLHECAESECVGHHQLLVEDGATEGLQAVTSVSSEVLRIPGEFLKRAVANDPQLAAQLAEAALEQHQACIALRSTVVDSLMFGNLQQPPRRVSLDADSVIFRQGEEGAAFYLIVNGSVRILRNEEGREREIAILYVGQPFGELALLRQQERQATVQTREPTTLLEFSAEQFQERFSSDLKLREYLQTLQKLYPIRAHGTTRQFNGRFEGQDCVVTFFRSQTGEPVSSSHVIGQQTVHTTLMARSAENCMVLNYEDPQRNVRLRVQLAGRDIVSITSWTLWRGIGPVYQRMLSATPLSDNEILLFRSTGKIVVDTGAPPADGDVVCHCMQVSYGAVTREIESGGVTVGHLKERLRCGSICGACIPALQEITGTKGWNAAQLCEQVELCPGTRRFTFRPAGSHFRESLVGQHVVIRARINDEWVSRPYTLTSSAGQREIQEVTIRRQVAGRFSSWLFDVADATSEIELSDPAGDCLIDLDKKNPLVFFCAGIGITPAIAAVRSHAETRSRRPLIIHYSEHSSGTAICRDEFKDACHSGSGCEFIERYTALSGRLNVTEINTLCRRFPEADFYLCGPQSYIDMVRQGLLLAVVTSDRIQTEHFAADAERSLQQQFSPDRPGWAGPLAAAMLTVATGCWLFLMPAGDSDRGRELQLVTGCVVLLPLLWQWHLPVLRWLGRSMAIPAARRFHQRIGVLLPILLLLHADRAGFALTRLLSAFFLLNSVIAYFPPDLLRGSDSFRRNFESVWLPLHIVLSFIVSAMAIAHGVTAMAYK